MGARKQHHHHIIYGKNLMIHTAAIPHGTTKQTRRRQYLARTTRSHTSIAAHSAARPDRWRTTVQRCSGDARRVERAAAAGDVAGVAAAGRGHHPVNFTRQRRNKTDNYNLSSPVHRSPLRLRPLHPIGVAVYSQASPDNWWPR